MSKPSNKPSPTPSRSHFPVVLPAILIILGAVFLLHNFGLLPWDTWTFLWRLWPIILVLVGLELIISRQSLRGGLLFAFIAVVLLILGIIVFSRAGCGRTTREFSYPLGELRGAEVGAKVGAGSFSLAALPATSDMLLSGNIKGRSQQEGVIDVEKVGDKAYVSLPGQKAKGLWPDGMGDWEVQLSPKVPLRLTLQAGASKLDLDLRELVVQELRLETGASSAYVRLPRSAGQGSAIVKAGAASITIEIPQGVAARIETDTGLSSLNFAYPERFTKKDNLYLSPGYDIAGNRIDLKIESGLASVTIK